MDLDPKHLATLQVIRERGGLTAAAAVLGTSQPALSRLVADMELRLGAPLFDRSSRPWRMTSLGESLASQGIAVRMAITRANHAVEQFQGGTDGLIKLGGTPYLSDAVLSPMVASFISNVPEVRVEQSLAYTAQLLRRLHRREVDLVIAPVDTMDITQGLQSRRLIRANNIVACRKDHPLLSLGDELADAVLDCSWITPPNGSPLEADMRSILNDLGERTVRTAFSGASLMSTMQMLESTDCLAVLPQYALNRLAKRYDIAALPLPLSVPTRSIAMITNADDVRSNLLSVFLDFMEDKLKQVNRS